MIGQDPYADALEQHKPEFMIVKNGRTGVHDLRLFDPSIDKNYSTELTDEAEGLGTMMRKATQRLINAWIADLTVKPIETEVVKV